MNQSEAVDGVFELKKVKRSHKLVEKAKLSTPKLGFGCAVDNYGEKIYCVGGTIGNQVATDKSEYYNVQEDRWVEMPELREAKFSLSLCIFSDQYLFAFGGYD